MVVSAYAARGRKVSNRRFFFPFVVVLTAALSFAFGFIACLHLKSTLPRALRAHELTQAGNAPASVRGPIVEQLHALQNGYIRRDPKDLNAFAASLFPNDGDVLILGSNGDTGEWARGLPASKKLIEGDWLYWGDVRFDSDHAIVWSSGDVAWIATIGTVGPYKRERPIRLTAILTRENNRWVFRQLHFQWDEKEPSRSDLLSWRTYLRLLSGAFRRVRAVL